jgi:transcriptional regulator with XRE-family HTH domain
MARLLRQREARGESLRSLAERTGIPVGTLSWWQHDLRRKPEAVPCGDDLEMIEVGRAAAQACFEVVVDGVTVRVPSQFDPASLATLLQVLAEC